MIEAVAALSPTAAKIVGAVELHYLAAENESPASGLDVKDIAKMVGSSPPTVRKYLREIEAAPRRILIVRRGGTFRNPSSHYIPSRAYLRALIVEERASRFFGPAEGGSS